MVYRQHGNGDRSGEEMKKVIFDKAAAILVVMAMLASPVPAMAEDGSQTGNDEQQNEMTADSFAPNETEDESIADSTAEGEDPAANPVTDVSAKSYGFESITISWKGESDTFKVLRKSGESWVKVGETSDNEYTDTGLKPDSPCTDTIRCREHARTKDMHISPFTTGRKNASK